MPAKTNGTPFTEADLLKAVDDLAMCSFFPHDSRASVMLLLAKMCPSREALQRLVREQVNRVGVWHGPAELRGILCSFTDPADGIDYWSTLPGYRAEDAEARFLLEHSDQKKQEISASSEAQDIVRQMMGTTHQLPAEKESR